MQSHGICQPRKLFLWRAEKDSKWVFSVEKAFVKQLVTLFLSHCELKKTKLDKVFRLPLHAFNSSTFSRVQESFCRNCGEANICEQRQQEVWGRRETTSCCTCLTIFIEINLIMKVGLLLACSRSVIVTLRFWQLECWTLEKFPLTSHYRCNLRIIVVWARVKLTCRIRQIQLWRAFFLSITVDRALRFIFRMERWMREAMNGKIEEEKRRQTNKIKNIFYSSKQFLPLSSFIYSTFSHQPAKVRRSERESAKFSIFHNWLPPLTHRRGREQSEIADEFFCTFNHGKWAKPNEEKSSKLFSLLSSINTIRAARKNCSTN